MRALAEKNAPYRRLGHEDVRTNFGWRREYESWPTLAQNSYERGRLMAQQVKSAGLDLPSWPDGKLRPRGWETLVEIAQERVGRGAVPNVR